MRWRIALLSVVVGGVVSAGDWPQLMGPNRDNSTTEVIPAWKDEPRVLWRKAVGEGKTPPVIVAGKLYYQDKAPDEQAERTFCLDAATGKELWRASYPRATYENAIGSGPRGAPVVTDGLVFTHGVTGILTCYDEATGKQVWQVDTHKVFEVPALRYGAHCSPLVVGNRVLINVGGKLGSVVGFDTRTGKVAWKALLSDMAVTSSPILYQAIGEELPHAVFLTDRRIVGVDPLEGTILWERKLADEPFNNGPSPVWLGDLLFTSARAFGGLGLRITKKADGYAVEEVWKNRDLGSYYPTVVPVDADQFWLTTNSQEAGAPVRCIERKTGKEVWKTKSLAEWHVGLIRTGDGKVLLYDGQGVLHLMAQTADGPKDLAQVKIGIGNMINQALADGRFYVRGRDEIVCVELVRKPQP